MNKILKKVTIVLSLILFNSQIFAKENYKELNANSTSIEVMDARSMIAKDISRHLKEIKENIYRNLSTQDIELNNHILYLNVVEMYQTNLYKRFSEKLSNPSFDKVNEFVTWWAKNNTFSLKTWINRCNLILDKEGKYRGSKCNLNNNISYANE